MKIILLLIFALFSLFSSYDCKKNNNYKPKCDCGIIPKGVTKKTKNSRIFKGKDATPYQFPWQVWIEVDFIARDRIVQQGGVLISKGHILTASHIFYYNYGINDRYTYDNNLIEQNTNKKYKSEILFEFLPNTN